MTDWNEKNAIMSLALQAERADTETMTNTRHTPRSDNLARTLRDAMGPGYQASMVTSSVERLLSQPAGASSTPGAVVFTPQSRRRLLLRLLGLVRRHRWAASSPSLRRSTALGISHPASTATELCCHQS